MTPRGMMFRATCIISLTFLLFACGGGGGDSTPAPAISVNASGYPDVAGLYSWNIKAGTMICTDNSTGPVDAFAKNVQIVQNINQILIGDTSSNPLPSNITIVSGTNMTGNVDPAANFITNQTLVMRMTGQPGDTTYLYNVTGAFTSTGWSGSYKMMMSNTSIGGSCSVTMPFTGELISKSATVKSPSEQAEAEAEAEGTPAKEESVYDRAARLVGLSVVESSHDDQ